MRTLRLSIASNKSSSSSIASLSTICNWLCSSDLSQQWQTNECSKMIRFQLKCMKRFDITELGDLELLEGLHFSAVEFLVASARETERSRFELRVI